MSMAWFIYLIHVDSSPLLSFLGTCSALKPMCIRLSTSLMTFSSIPVDTILSSVTLSQSNSSASSLASKLLCLFQLRSSLILFHYIGSKSYLLIVHHFIFINHNIMLHPIYRYLTFCAIVSCSYLAN